MAEPIRRENVLRHPCRDALYDLVHREPGVNFVDLYARVRALPGFEDLGYGSYQHHLHKLQDFGLLGRSGSTPGGFHAVGWAYNGMRAQQRFLESPLALAVGRLIGGGHGLSLTGLLSLVRTSRDVSQAQLREVLIQFESHGLVSVSTYIRSRCYHPTRVLGRLLGTCSDVASTHPSSKGVSGRPRSPIGSLSRESSEEQGT